MNQETSCQLHSTSWPWKIFTACLWDTVFDFIMRNNCIDCKLQKGFLRKVSGTFEHTAHMTNIINQARKKRRSVLITLLDLKNAFDEVHHNLIIEVFKYHHIPEFIQTLISMKTPRSVDLDKSWTFPSL